jgi:hypothetical protein
VLVSSESREAIGYDHGYDGEVFYLTLEARGWRAKG